MSRTLAPSTLIAVLTLGSSAPAQSQFAALQTLPAQTHAYAMVVSDVDGDGDPDLVTASVEQPMRVFLNDGRGGLEELPGAGPAEEAWALDLTAGDIDGDGDADLVMVRADRQLRILINDGGGRFHDESAARIGVLIGHRRAVLADFDRDADPDLLLLGARHLAEPPRLFWNEGGSFRVAAPLVLPPVPTPRRLRVADLDRDGDLDVLIPAEGPDVLLLWENDTLVDRSDRFRTAPETSLDIALGDVDADGDLDAVVVQVRVADPLLVMRNDGGARFEPAPGAVPNAPDLPFAAALGDVDGDGDLDLAAGTWSNQPARLYLNDGAGAFTEAVGRLPGDLHRNEHLAFVDLDEDRDLDLVVGNLHGRGGADQSQIWTNRHRHAHLTAAPRIGGAFTAELTSEPGYARLFALAVPMFAAAERRIPFEPFGLLRLDPASLVATTPIWIPPHLGTATLRQPVPNDPQLAGRPLRFQAVFVTPAGSARFGNLIATSIGR